MPQRYFTKGLSQRVTNFFISVLYTLLFVILGFLYRSNETIYTGIFLLALTLIIHPLTAKTDKKDERVSLIYFVIFSIGFYFFLIFSNISFRFLIFATLFPLMLYVFIFSKRFILLSLSNLALLDILFLIGIDNLQFLYIILINVIYLITSAVLATYQYFVSQKADELDYKYLKSQAKANFEKEMIAFATHQLRSISNNFIISDEVQFSKNDNKSNNDLKKFKDISFSSLNSVFVFLENILDNDNHLKDNNILFLDVFQKITSFYRMKNTNLSFDFNKRLDIEVEYVNKSSFLRSIFLTIDLIEKFFVSENVHIKIEFLDVNNDFQIKYTIDSSLKIDKVQKEIEILKELLAEELGVINAEIEYGLEKENYSFIQITYKEMKVNIREKYMQQNIKGRNDLKYSLLLAEDDEINIKIYTLGFEKYFGEIDIARNGNEVIEKLKQRTYDLLVMDLQMPSMNGIDAIMEIRKMEKSTGNHIFAIGITANVLVYNKQEVLDFGFDDYFIKPFKVKDLYNSFINLKKQNNGQ